MRALLDAMIDLQRLSNTRSQQPIANQLRERRNFM
jgi:hypothetical protein